MESNMDKSGYAFRFGNRVSIKHGFYEDSLATVKRVDEKYREHDGTQTVYVKLYGVEVDGDESKTIQWFRGHNLTPAPTKRPKPLRRY